MPISRTRRLRTLSFFLPLMLAACSGSSDDEKSLASADGILRYVPANTPYVFAVTEPLPDEVADKFAPHVEALADSYETLLLAAVNHDPADDTATRLDEDSRARLTALIGRVAGMVSGEGIPEAGIDRKSTAAIYGVGLLPVLRVTLSDGALFESTLEELENEAGEKLAVAEIDGHSYRYAGDDDGRVLVAVIDDQLVVSVVPASLPEDLLKSVLGLELPKKSIAQSGELVALAGKYGLSAHGLGMLDIQRIAATFLDDQEGVNRELLALADYDGSAFSEVCKSEIRALSGIAPRIVAGYTDVTEDHIKSTTVIELRSDIAAGVQTLTAPVPGLGLEHGGLMSVGMSLDMLAAREFYSARLDAIEADPFECEFFADIQEGVVRGRELLNQPIPPIVYGFRGFLAVINDIEGMDIANQQPPTDVDMRVLVATDNAPGLLAMGAMFSPQIASMNLKPDAKPVKLDLPPVAAVAEAAWVAMSENALALSFGNGSEAGLEAMLAASPGDPSPFLSLDVDAARYYGFIGDAMALSDDGDQPPEVVKAQRELMQVFAEMLERISFDVLFTENGIEMPSTLKLAE